MNRGFSLLPRGLCEPLRGGLASPRGRALGLLQGSGLEELSDLISSPAGIGVRRLGHVPEEHGGGDDVLAGSSENRGVDGPVLVDATVDVASSLASSPARRAFRTLTLEGLLEQIQVLPFFVKFFLQLADLLELHSLIRKELSLVPVGGVLDMKWRVPPFG
jgi:hypothetical protein